jgi:hypothetical protein
VRCYLMRRGHIENVEMLRDGPDEELIGRRFVCREPPN